MRYWLAIVFFLFIAQVVNAEEGLVGYWKFESVNLTNYTQDSSGNENDGKLINFGTNPPTIVVGKIGQAVQFDGVDDYVNISNSSSLNFSAGFAIEAWVKTSQAGVQRLITKGNLNNFQWEVALGPSGLYSTQYTGCIGVGNELSSTKNIADGAWHYIVVVVTPNSAMTHYIDGIVNATSSSTGNTCSKNGAPLLVGKRGNETTNYFNGTIDEIKIWNRSLTAMEVWENYFGKRTNPIVVPDISEVSGNLNKNYTFNITVTNVDNESYGNSTFKLVSDCPTEWNCSINPANQTISPRNSSSYKLTIKPVMVTEEKTLVNVTAINMNDTRYNTTIRVGFILGSKCDKASVKITDVYFYANTSANVTVENDGASNLKILSAVITDSSGKTYKADKLPIAGFDSGEKEYIIFTNISSCEDFSKIVVSTDCPKVSANYTEARCQIKAIVKIRSVKYENDTVKIELRNGGSEAITSSSIKLLIDGKGVVCKQVFQLLPSGIEKCDVVNFKCSNVTAKLKITDPNLDEKEFECLKSIVITAETCSDRDCNELSSTFEKGKNVYLNVGTAPNADITATVSLNDEGEKQLIDVTQPFKPKKAGSYTIELTASREGYKETISRVEFTVIEGGGFPTKIVLAVLGIAVLAGFIVFYRNYRKNKEFEKLYKKYGAQG